MQPDNGPPRILIRWSGRGLDNWIGNQLWPQTMDNFISDEIRNLIKTLCVDKLFISEIISDTFLAAATTTTNTKNYNDHFLLLD